MPAGTISLTNNSTAVAGVGTDFESELNANDFIVITLGGETYTLGVAAVVSGTALTLIRPFSGPTTSGIAWGVVPANTMVRIAAELAEQTTFALRANNIAKINWNAVFSESGDITVTLLDGTTFNGPSWKKIVDLLEAVDLEAVQQLADQVRADAQQVSTDKTTASNAATSASGSATSAGNSASAAQTAKTAAETANTNSQQAKTDAISAKTAAEAARDAAQQANPDNQLKKANNLSDVSNAATALANLNGFDKSKAGYALVDFGSVAYGQRKVVANPFGNSVPVFVETEVLVGTEWAKSCWLFNTTSAVGIGLNGGFVLGEGLVVQAGSGGTKATNNGQGGALHASASGGTNPSSVRMHIWKLQN